MRRWITLLEILAVVLAGGFLVALVTTGSKIPSTFDPVDPQTLRSHLEECPLHQVRLATVDKAGYLNRGELDLTNGHFQFSFNKYSGTGFGFAQLSPDQLKQFEDLLHDIAIPPLRKAVRFDFSTNFYLACWAGHPEEFHIYRWPKREGLPGQLSQIFDLLKPGIPREQWVKEFTP